jgi:hypothetical protein
MAASTRGLLLDMRMKLSTLWIFAMFNYIYADIFSLMDPVVHKEIETGITGSMQITPGFLFIGAVQIEIAIAMVLLSRILKHGANRWANVIAGAQATVFIVLSMFTGAPAPYYLFFNILEIACTLLIIWLALRWKPEDAA